LPHYGFQVSNPLVLFVKNLLMLHFSARAKQAAFSLLLILSIPTAVWSQSALSEAGVGDNSSFLFELEAYAKYGGDIDVIDGMTGMTW
jgi:hypothetical protein